MPRPLPILLACALLAGCATDGAAPPATKVTGVAPNLPRGMVRTDGHNAIAVALAGSAACARTSPAEAAAALASANGLRRARGLAPLATDARLQRAAEAHACDMARRGTMTHVGASTSGPRARAAQQGYVASIATENIAAGRLDLRRVLAEWAGSPAHARNAVFPQLTQTGIGHAVSADGKSAFWAVVYAAPR